MKAISCKEAVEYILKKEESKLSFKQRIQLWRHLAICSLCRIFQRQNNLINTKMKDLNTPNYKLSDTDKETIINNIFNDGKSE